MNVDQMSFADLKAMHDLATEMWPKKKVSSHEKEQYIKLGAMALEEMKRRVMGKGVGG